MPSALETLVKILKLERDQGGKDSAVIGGLSAFCEGWEKVFQRKKAKIQE